MEQERKKRDAKLYAPLATQFIGNRNIVFYQGRTLVFDGKRYVEETALTHKVRRWLIDNELTDAHQTVSNVAACVESLKLIDHEIYKAMPFYWGIDDFPVNVIPYQNGLLDVDGFCAGRVEPLKKHTADWISTFCLPYHFDPAATCPEWEAFLNEILEGDQQRIDILQEWFGYCLTQDTRHQKALIKVGPPRGGKGTTDAVLRALVGEDNSTAYDLHALAERFGKWRLIGKQVAFVGEVNLEHCRDKYHILETFNSIVGGDGVSCEGKGLNQVPTVLLPTRFTISCNEMPPLPDSSGALTSRLLIVPFNRSFVGSEDRGLQDRLLGELSGIGNWALRGLARLKTQGAFSSSDEMKERTQRFRRDTSDAFAFMQDCLRVERWLDPGNLAAGIELVDEPQQCTANEVNAKYSEWCQGDARPHGYSPQNLKKGLTAILPRLKSERVGKQNVTTYFGIGIKPSKTNGDA